MRTEAAKGCLKRLRLPCFNCRNCTPCSHWPHSIPSGIGRRIRGKKAMTISWDKNSLEIEIKYNIIIRLEKDEEDGDEEDWKMRQQKREGGIKPKRNRRIRGAQHSCSPPTANAHPIHQQLLTISSQFIYQEWHSVAWSLDQLFMTCSLPASCSSPHYQKLKSPWFGASTTEEIPKHQCIVNIILRLNTKKTTVPDSRNKIIPVETRTERWQGETWRPQYIFFLLQFSRIRAQELQASQPYLRPLEENEPNMLRGLLQLYKR